MSSEHRNRHNKAEAITAILITVGCDSDAAQALDDTGWKLAAMVAAERNGTRWVDASPATRRMVIGMLADQERRQADEAEGLVAHVTDDVFASIAAGSSLPRPAGDPDSPPAETCGDCGRPVTYDDATESYRHLVDPERGCFLICPETPSGAVACRWCGRPSFVTTTEGPACNECEFGRDAIAADGARSRTDAAPTGPVPVGAWLAGINYGASPTEGWD